MKRIVVNWGAILEWFVNDVEQLNRYSSSDYILSQNFCTIEYRKNDEPFLLKIKI